MRFHNRIDAGRQLAERLAAYRDQSPIVVALPRGGVPVGFEVARALGAPLDILVARKLGAPGQPELGIGAIAQDGTWFLNDELIEALAVTGQYLDRVAQGELAEIERRLERYRGDRPPLDVRGRVTIVVDDGLATGVTTRAAVRALHKQQPRALVLAVPVCAPDTAHAIRGEIDDVICVAMPEHFRAVGLWYQDFSQTTDEEVIALLEQARREFGAAGERQGGASAPGLAQVPRRAH